MVSLHDTFVEDRERFRDGSFAARVLRRLDRAAFRAADLVVADTRANANLMAELGELDEVAVCYVGAEERLFRPGWRRSDGFHVLFVGKLAPLHGLEVILGAARLLPDVSFRVVGAGQVTHLLETFQALAVGTPVVTADTPAARELLVGGRDCLLVDRTADSLAEAIVALRDDPTLAERIGAGGRATFEREASEAVLGVRWREAVERATERRRGKVGR
jgi:glycosyltransferase involved in cell wall biosynthesis